LQTTAVVLDEEGDVDRIVNVSDRSNAAIHALALAAAGNGRVTAALCAQELGVSPSYLAKVLQLLVRGGLLSSTRGASGGFDLARDASGISCLEVIELIEGPLPRRECLFRATVCPKGGCALKAMCERIEKAVGSALVSTSVAAIATSFKR
jgi:Rrf2 family protein